MKKYLLTSCLFVFNLEVISWIAIVIIAGMGLVDFIKMMEKGGFFK